MTPLAQLMEAVFILAWGAAVCGWIYGTRFWMGMWMVRFDRSRYPPRYRRKAIVGYGIFAGAIGAGFIAGGIAQLWGGGWH
jgi:hypothetical protein